MIRVITNGSEEENGSSTIELDGIHSDAVNGKIKYVKFFIDTIQENVSDRSNSILNKLELKIVIDATTKQACKNFMDWALLSTGRGIKRTVDIVIQDSNNENDNSNDCLRSFHLAEMFVEDFKEEYAGEEKYFIIKLTQTQGHSSEFQHDTIRLV